MAKRNTAKIDARDARTAEKANQALALRRAGATYRQVGEQLGIAQSYAHELVGNAIADIPRENAEAVLSLELERLDRDLRRCEAAHDKLEPRVKAGEDAAITAMLRVMDRTRHIQDRRAAYLGLDAPKRTELSGPEGGPVRPDRIEIVFATPPPKGTE